MSSYGWAFIAFATVWLGLNLHSGIVRYFESTGAKAFEAVRLPDELALAQSDPRSWLTAADRDAIVLGRDSFRTAHKLGLLTNVPAISKWAWLEYLSGEENAAVDLLQRASVEQDGPSGSLFTTGQPST